MDTKNSLAAQNNLDFGAIERANLSERTRAQYVKALANCLQAGVRVTDPGELAEYAAKLPASSRAFLKAALRLATADFANNLKSGATPENLPMVQAALMRLDAINQAIHTTAPKGEKAHTWLSQAQVKALMNTCEDTEEGRRDWVVLALMVGAGLRREELVRVTCSDVRDLPMRNGKSRWVLHTVGKGAKERDIPISAVLAERLRAWCDHIEGGKVARSLGRRKVLGESLSEIAAFQIVRKHGAAIGKPGLDPHDLRRTFAQLGYEAGVPITQLSKLLGHSDIATTQRYLNLDLDLESTVSDFIPL